MSNQDKLTDYQIEVLLNKIKAANDIQDSYESLREGAVVLGQALRLLGYDQLVDEFEKGA